MKKLLISVIALGFLTGCNNTTVTQPQDLLTTDQVSAQSKTPESNSLFGFSITTGQMYFFDAKPGDKGVYGSPEVLPKKLLSSGRFNNASLTMPSGTKVSGYFKTGNDSALYLEDYTTKKNYKIGTWSKKGGFTKKETLEKFDIKLENIKDVKAELHLNPMADEYLFFSGKSHSPALTGFWCM